MKSLYLTFILILTFGYTTAHPGIGIVYDGNETVYFTDLSHVWKINVSTGVKEIALENIHTHELFLDEKGTLYGEHYWYVANEQKFKNYIWCLTKSGHFRKIRSDQYGENTDFGFVRDASFASYEIHQKKRSYHIVKKDSSSKALLHSQTLKKPTWKYLTKNNQLLFVDYPKIYSFENQELKEIVTNISSLRFPFSIQGDDHNIYGIWQDRTENFYVAIYGGREVKKIDQNGTVSRVLKTDFFWSPINGVFDNEQNLWLMESSLNGTTRVRKIPKTELTNEASFLLENITIASFLLSVFGFTFYLIKRKRNRK